MAYQNHHIDPKDVPRQGQRVNRSTAIAVSMVGTLLIGTPVPAIHESNRTPQFSQSANVRKCQPLKHSALKCVACHEGTFLLAFSVLYVQEVFFKRCIVLQPWRMCGWNANTQCSHHNLYNGGRLTTGYSISLNIQGITAHNA